MKRILQKAFAILLSVIIAVFIWYGIKRAQMDSAEMEMDRRELNYDADGGFVMIDTMAAHMGVYDATKPLLHIWKERLRRLDPGVYHLTICDGWLELYSNDMHGVYVIFLRQDETDFFLENVEQDIPVLAY